VRPCNLARIFSGQQIGLASDELLPESGPGPVTFDKRTPLNNREGDETLRHTRRAHSKPRRSRPGRHCLVALAEADDIRRRGRTDAGHADVDQPLC
jgi:hypothetical protein